MPETLYFAPFQGLTTYVFRRVFARHFSGMNALFTPFFYNISAGIRLSEKKQKELTPLSDTKVKIIPQILSKDAREIILFSQHARRMGHTEINWNLGCPYPQVANKKRGSGLLPFPQLIQEIMQEVCAEAVLPLSIKCRLGYEDAAELFQLMPVFNAFPLRELIVHPRLGTQLYSGIPDRSAFAEIMKISQIPLVYNGDIFSAQDWVKLQAEFPGIHTWMIGRGALYNPMLAEQIQGITASKSQPERSYLFLTDLYRTYRHEMNERTAALDVLKEYWQYAAHAWEEPIEVFRKIRKVRTFDAYEDAVSRVFELKLAEYPPTF